LAGIASARRVAQNQDRQLPQNGEYGGARIRNDPAMGVSPSGSRRTARLALVTNPPPAAPDAPTGVPAGLRLLRTLDRAVLEVAREIDVRPMELYGLLLLSDGPVTTRRLADLLATSQSQAKQIALRLAGRGYAERSGTHGRTELTDSGLALARDAAARLEREIADRLGQIEKGALASGTSTLSSLLMRATG
jgi:hypothetical protein